MIVSLMTDTIVPGFLRSGEYTGFGQQYQTYTHSSLQTELHLSSAGEIVCAKDNNVSDFIGAIALILDDAPDSLIAATNMQESFNLEVLKRTHNARRNWVFRHPALQNIVLKVGSDPDENRIQFHFMNHLQHRLALRSSVLRAPEQHALLQTKSGISAVFMNHLPGEMFDKRTELNQAQSGEVVANVKSELHSALDHKDHIFLNDIGHNDHYANILYSAGDMLGIIDLPNMSNPLERAAILSSYQNFLS